MKKIYICLLGIFISILLVVGSLIIINKKHDSNYETSNGNNSKTETITSYSAYVSINPMVKLNFEIKCKKEECSEPIVKDFELYNEDAKKDLSELKLKDKTLNDSIDEIRNLAIQKKYKADNVKVYTNWKNKEYLSREDYNLNVEYKDNLDKEVEEIKKEEDSYITKTVNVIPQTLVMNLSSEYRTYALSLTNGNSHDFKYYEVILKGKKEDLNKICDYVRDGRNWCSDEWEKHDLGWEYHPKDILLQINLNGYSEGTYKVELEYLFSEDQKDKYEVVSVAPLEHEYVDIKIEKR